MKLAKYRFFLIIAIVVGFALILPNMIFQPYSGIGFEIKDNIKLTKILPTPDGLAGTFEASIIASPVADLSHGQPRLIVPVSDGRIVAMDGKNGRPLWELRVPVPEGQQAQLVATPVKVGDKLVVVYQCLLNGGRASHRLAVLDLLNNQWDEGFPVLVFAAEKKLMEAGKGVVKFNAATAYSHAALKHWKPRGGKYGYVYAGFGNASDIQPFHGWLFEIDLDAWQNQGVGRAIKNVLLTTPEADCPVKMEHGTQEMICGGGVWVPAGPLIAQTGDDVDIFVPTGNGQVDLARHDYANALLRVKPGLQFEDGCDTGLCANFNPLNPDPACIASCKNLFIPRLSAGNAPIRPPHHECDDMNFWECLAWMDFDLGANVPVKVKLKDGRDVLVQAGKDGGAYLVDAKQLGIQYDRLQIASLCGSPTDLCRLSWAGMIVTQPLLATVDDNPIVIIPTFNADKTHVAGVVALKIELEDGVPKLGQFWRFPDDKYPDALKMFRNPPSFPLLVADSGLVWIVDIGSPGTLYGIRLKDGSVAVKQPLQGSGRQLSMPLLVDDTLYISSMMPDTGKTMIEAYRIEAEP